MSYIKRLQHQLKYGLLTRSVLLRLNRIGLVILPYILYEEFVIGSNASPDIDYQIERISLKNLDYINEQLPGSTFSLGTFEERLSSGDIGIMLIHDDELAGYCWANLRYCRFRRNILFELNQEEAYLYDAYVGERFRGRSFVVALRRHLAEELRRTGRNRYFSISEFFNTPARKFKKKLRAEPLETRLSVDLFRSATLDIRLSKFDEALSKRVPFIARKKVADL